MRIAVISDTHDRYPATLPERLRAADEIWHLGDVCDPEILAEVRATASVSTLPRARAAVRTVHVSDDVARYVVRLVSATRETDQLRLGASPRASLSLLHAAQASAALAGRDYVTPDDVQDLVTAVLAHRLLLARDAAIDRRDPEDVLREVVAGVPVPAEVREDEPAVT